MQQSESNKKQKKYRTKTLSHLKKQYFKRPSEKKCHNPKSYEKHTEKKNSPSAYAVQKTESTIKAQKRLKLKILFPILTGVKVD